jgi:hypothetical protein
MLPAKKAKRRPAGFSNQPGKLGAFPVRESKETLFVTRLE